jgi:hypothetical protein
MSKSPLSTPFAAFASIVRSWPVVSSFPAFIYRPFKFVYIHGQFINISQLVHKRCHRFGALVAKNTKFRLWPLEKNMAPIVLNV